MDQGDLWHVGIAWHYGLVGHRTNKNLYNHTVESFHEVRTSGNFDGEKRADKKMTMGIGENVDVEKQPCE